MMNKNEASTTKKIAVRYRSDAMSELFKFDQLYGVVHKGCIYINGSVEMVGEDPDTKTITVYVNFCNKDGAILEVLDRGQYSTRKGMYHSFSFCQNDLYRPFDLDELDYAELYLGYNEQNQE